MSKKIKSSSNDGWRRPTPEERKMFEIAATNTLRRLGRPITAPDKKYVAISIKLDPKILKWAKKEAKKRNIGYQTVINEELLKKAS